MLFPQLAFEVYDDVAAYWFIITLLGFVVVPRGLYMAYTSFFSKAKGEGVQVHNIGEDGLPIVTDKCREKAQKLAEEKAKNEKKSRYSCWNILWWCTALVFVYMLLNVRTMESRSMYSFNPYKILEVEPGASPRDIKKAFRKLSLIHHPDKNPNNPDAEQQFVLLSKAYQTLTDDATRENYEKYGNPDGYQGTSVTIGLPSLLLDKENENLILLIYLGLMILLPIVVGIWWRSARLSGEQGVYHETVGLYYEPLRTRPDNMPVKYLVQILGRAAEFKELAPPNKIPSQEEILVLQKMFRKLKSDDILKKEVKVPMYMAKAIFLIHYHMNRIELPLSMEPSWRLCMSHIEKLTDTMIQLYARTNNFDACFNAVELKQKIIQALKPHDSPLMQLPYFSEKDAKVMKAFKNYREMAPKTKRKLLRGFSDEMINECDRVVELIPDVEVTYKRRVKHEETQVIYGGTTLLTLNVYLNRKKWKATPIVEEENNNSSNEEVKEDEVVATKVEKESESGSVDEPASDEEEEDREFDPLQLDFGKYDVSKQAEEEKKKKGIKSPIVYAPHFPSEKREVWYILLKDNTRNELIGFSRTTSFNEREKLNFSFPVPRVPETAPYTRIEYSLHVLCDSYVGVDNSSTFHIDVYPPKPELEEDSGDESDEEMPTLLQPEDVEGYWYYFYCTSLGELFLNSFLLTLVFLFLFNFLYSRGWFYTFTTWWGAYGAPIWAYTGLPIWNVFRPFVVQYLYNLDAEEVLDEEDSDSYYD